MRVFDIVLLLLIMAVGITILFRQIRLPDIVGYIILGVIVGPHAVGFVDHSEYTHATAEFGIVFLMFTIGLEFSVGKLISLRRVVFGYGGLQVLLTILATTGICIVFGLPMVESVVIGGVVSMSSTAIVLKQLTKSLEVNTKHGSLALGILLFQDLAVIPLLILVPSLAGVGGDSIFMATVWAVVKGICAIGLILMSGRWLLRPVFFYVAQTRSYELFTIMALLTTLGSAWFTQKLGLSLALGSFLAGIMLAETDFRHQIEAVIRPFQDILLGFFFISIGMQFDPHILPNSWNWMLLLLLALLVLKTILVTGIGIVLKEGKANSLRTGFLLAQGGEFGFALLLLALDYNLIHHELSQIILGALLMSMVIAPLMIKFNKQLTELFTPKALHKCLQEAGGRLSEKTEHLSNHVIVCGYGQAGQTVTHFLEKAKIGYIALEMDPKLVETAHTAGENVCYADATNQELLTAAGVQRAKAVVITFFGLPMAKKVLQQVRQVNKKIPVIVRCDKEEQATELYELGATEAVPEIVEASLLLASHVLLLMKVPVNKVRHWMFDVRRHRYDLLRMIFHGDELNLDEHDESNEGLHTVTLDEQAYAVGRTVEEMELANHGVKLTSIRRQGQGTLKVRPTTRFAADDVLVLYGDNVATEEAEQYLLDGLG